MKYILGLILFVNQIGHAQTSPCDSLFNAFKKDVQIVLAKYDRLIWDDETNLSYYELMLNCPTESLVKYADDSIPAIRCLIFSGLIEKEADGEIINQILSKYKSDTAEYICPSLSFFMDSTVGNYMQTMIKLKTDGTLSNKKIDYQSSIKDIKNEPRIIIPGLSHGMILKDDLLQLDSLTHSNKDLKIISFTLTSCNGEISLETNNDFNDEVKNFINKIQPRECLYIENIRVEVSNNGIRRIPGMIIEIK